MEGNTFLGEGVSCDPDPCVEDSFCGDGFCTDDEDEISCPDDCEYDDGPPECMLDCENITNPDDDFEGFCQWLDAEQELEDSCLDDCLESEFFNMFTATCAACELHDVFESCQEWWDTGDLNCEDDTSNCDHDSESDCDSDVYCFWDGLGCLPNDPYQICPEYSTEGECEDDERCNWIWDGYEELCEVNEEDDGPPECILDCAGVDDIDPNGDANEFCMWVTETWVGSDCIGDCVECEYFTILILNTICEVCLDAGDCSGYFDGPDEPFCGDSFCSDDEDEYSCPEDCGWELGACCSDFGNIDYVGNAYCEDMIEEEFCLVVNGIWYGPGSFCSDLEVMDECAGEPEIGACCYGDDTGSQCEDMIEEFCLDLYGNWHGPGSLCSDPWVMEECSHHLGACCYESDDHCEDGYIPDCADADCCEEGWIGDGYPDCEDQQFGCDLTCYENDGGDCDAADAWSDSSGGINSGIDISEKLQNGPISRDATESYCEEMSESDCYYLYGGSFYPSIDCSDQLVVDECSGDTGMLGDLNDDGVVDVMDLVSLVDIILSGSDYLSVGDIDGDGAINVTDVVLLVDTILGGGLHRGYPINTGDILQTEHSLIVSNDGKVAGIQLVISGDFNITESYLPAGWEIHHENGILLAFSTDGSSLTNGQLFQYSGNMTVESGIIADWHGNSMEISVSEIPNEYIISQVYPNPFNPRTSIQYVVPRDGIVDISVYDIKGKRIIRLLNDYQTTGSHTITWTADDRPSGIYMVKLTAGDVVETVKVMLLK
tara:strand:- start:353 stop:2668 length:2316 start_codon:yes stop_codon:yes gene_type:complete